LIATAKNESGVEIRFARICIIAAAMQKECLFRLWNTELWPPGAVLNWNVLTTQRVASLTQSASLVDFEIATAPEAQPSVSASPRPHLPRRSPSPFQRPPTTRVVSWNFRSRLLIGRTATRDTLTSYRAFRIPTPAVT
jgi:hypothetical protein